MSRFVLVAVLGLVACGGSNEAGDPARAGGVGGSNQFFGTVPELQLRGYVRHEPTGLANEAELGDVSFEDIRASTDKTHALLHVYDTAAGNLPASHWWLDLPGVYLPALVLLYATFALGRAAARGAERTR